MDSGATQRLAEESETNSIHILQCVYGTYITVPLSYLVCMLILTVMALPEVLEPMWTVAPKTTICGRIQN
jgi:hypothetical protein